MGAPDIGVDEQKAVIETLKSGWITQGPRTEKFEKELCTFTNSTSAIAMNNGTSTLYAALLALGVGPGDEVLVPNLTYLSSVSTILMTGAKPVLLSCDETFNTPPDLLREALTAKTKAVMSVDMKGMPIDYGAYSDFCDEYGVFWIADSAESLGATYNGKEIGSLAPIHSFSFFANKNITSGEGGAITLNQVSLEETLRSIRNQGQGAERYVHDRLGGNFRYLDLLAAIASVQLARLDTILDRKNFVAAYYDDAFSGISTVKTPKIPHYVTQHSWYNYCLLFNCAQTRVQVQKQLERENIETRRSFPPMHTQPFMIKQNFKLHGTGDNENDLYERMLDIPSHHNLSTYELDRVINVIMETIRG